MKIQPGLIELIDFDEARGSRRRADAQERPDVIAVAFAISLGHCSAVLSTPATPPTLISPPQWWHVCLPSPLLYRTAKPVRSRAHSTVQNSPRCHAAESLYILQRQFKNQMRRDEERVLHQSASRHEIFSSF